MIKTELKNTQLMILIIGYIFGSTYVFRFTDSIAQQDTWIIIIIGFVFSIPLLICYSWLMKRFPDKNLLDILEIVYSPVIGKILSALYVFFFLSLFYLNLSTIVEFYTSYIMMETPQMFFYVVFTLCCAFAVKKGIVSIARVSFILVIIAILVIAITFFLLLGNMDFSNFLPILHQPVQSYIQTTHNMVSITFCEIVFILMFTPFIREKKKSMKYVIGGVGLSALTYIIISVRNVAALGGLTSIYSTSSFGVARLINLGDFLSRVELIIALTITASLFIKIAIAYYLTSESLSQLLGMKSHTALIIPIGAIGIILGVIAFENKPAVFTYGTKYYIFFTMPFEIFIPVITLIVAKIRKLNGYKKEEPV